MGTGVNINGVPHVREWFIMRFKMNVIATMKVKHVRQAQTKHCIIMHFLKKIMRRSTGMGLKITKFHGIMHIADDTLNFGVPMEVDTGSNESAHKREKTAAKLTQKRRNSLMNKQQNGWKKSIFLILQQKKFKATKCGITFSVTQNQLKLRLKRQ